MIIVANWKMNKDVKEANLFLEEFLLNMSWCNNQNLEILIAPPFPILSHVKGLIFNRSMDYKLDVCSQNCNHNNEGAFTGEVSAKMLKSIGVNFGIVGHSERRQYFHETDDILLKKIEICFKNDLTPIFCFGESQQERSSGKFLNIIQKQLLVLKEIPEKNREKIILAYEPVWAIGTGNTPTVEEIEQIHSFTKNIFKNSKILYGGSLNSLNAKEILSLSYVDGGLIGGASLNASEFISIIRVANEIS